MKDGTITKLVKGYKAHNKITITRLVAGYKKNTEPKLFKRRY